MDFSRFHADPLWKMARDFGRILIRLEGTTSSSKLTDRAYALLRLLTRVIAAENIMAAQEGREEALDLCREIETALNYYFGTTEKKPEEQIGIFFLLEQLREMIFLEKQEDSALVRDSA